MTTDRLHIYCIICNSSCICQKLFYPVFVKVKLIILRYVLGDFINSGRTCYTSTVCSAHTITDNSPNGLFIKLTCFAAVLILLSDNSCITFAEYLHHSQPPFYPLQILSPASTAHTRHLCHFRGFFVQ